MVAIHSSCSADSSNFFTYTLCGHSINYWIYMNGLHGLLQYLTIKKEMAAIFSVILMLIYVMVSSLTSPY